MIFAVPGHIEQIRNGLVEHPPIAHIPPKFIIKTQSRRPNRGVYQVGKDYAVQRKRGVKAEPDIRIVMEQIWPEHTMISKADANAEGGYTHIDFERVFKELNPGWDESVRWAFKFHVVRILTKCATEEMKNHE